MFHSESGSLESRVAHARQAGDLYFAALLPKETINEAFGGVGGLVGVGGWRAGVERAEAGCFRQGAHRLAIHAHRHYRGDFRHRAFEPR